MNMRVNFITYNKASVVRMNVIIKLPGFSEYVLCRNVLCRTGCESAM